MASQRVGRTRSNTVISSEAKQSISRRFRHEYGLLRRKRSSQRRCRKLRFEFQTAYTRPYSRGGSHPRFAYHCPSEEGAGNAGCALHPRSRVQIVRVKTHTSIQGSGEHPTFPAQWFDGLSRAHPGVSGSSRLRRLRIAGSSAPGRADLPSTDLTPTTEASGPHDFAVRFGTARLLVLKTAHGVYPALQSHRAHDAAASTAIPSQRSVTMANAPFSGIGWPDS